MACAAAYTPEISLMKLRLNMIIYDYHGIDVIHHTRGTANVNFCTESAGISGLQFGVLGRSRRNAVRSVLQSILVAIHVLTKAAVPSNGHCDVQVLYPTCKLEDQDLAGRCLVLTARRLLITCRQPASPSCDIPHTNSRPTITACAPSAIALNTSAPVRMPESNRIVISAIQVSDHTRTHKEP